MNEAYGLGAIALALVALIGKIWIDNAKTGNRVLDVLETNATVMTELKGAIDKNTEATNGAKKAQASSNRNITLLIAKIVKNKK